MTFHCCSVQIHNLLYYTYTCFNNHCRPICSQLHNKMHAYMQLQFDVCLHLSIYIMHACVCVYLVYRMAHGHSKIATSSAEWWVGSSHVHTMIN